MRVAIAALLILTALSGCVSPTTALGLREPAQDEADRLADSAMLVAAFGPEWTNETFGESFRQDSPEAATIDQGVDLNLGDGLANAWGFLFDTDDGLLLVVMSAAGTVLETDFVDKDSNTAQSYNKGEPIGEVTVDSDEAATIVRENHDNFATLVQAEDAVVVMVLGHDSDRGSAVWLFTAFTQSDESFALAIVDANDGTYQDFSEFFG